MKLRCSSAATILAIVSASPAVLAQGKGFADLHNHPANHLGFGHKDASGDSCNVPEGIFHGTPGQVFDLANPEATIRDDLSACEPETHSACFNPNVVQKRQRTAIINLVETHYGAHLKTGAPTYEGWPSASSRTHQQMHLKWLKRAFDGGLRLMIASVTDNELLTKWYQDDASCDGGPKPKEGHDHATAVAQIAFIQQLAIDNASWMGIATTAAEAKDLLDHNRLVLVLGLELDSLKIEEMLDLIRNHGVRSVIPVHLADNDIGGTAVYTDLFNASNWWLRGSWFNVEHAPELSFRLSRPTPLGEDFLFPVGCAFGPKKDPIGDEEYRPMNYECIAGSDPFLCIPPGVGHRNQTGLLDPTAIRALMHEGILLDVVHMGAHTVDDTLAIAETFDYPVIDSHTGLRDHTRVGDSERALTFAQARRIAQLGGVVGIGTEGGPPRRSILSGSGGPFVRLTGGTKESRTHFRADDELVGSDVARRLVVRIETGGDDLRGSDGLLCSASTAKLRMHTTAGSFEVDANLARGAGLGGNTTMEAVVDLTTVSPGPTRVDSIRGFTLSRVSGGGCIDADNWNVDGLTVEYQGTTSAGAVTGGLLLERSGVPYKRLTNASPSVFTGIARSNVRREANRNDVIRRLDFDLVTGVDDLDSGTGNNLTAVIALRGGGKISRRVRDPLMGFTGGFRGGESARVTWDLTREGIPGVSYGDIESIYFTERSSDSEVDWDNWPVSRYRVTWSGCRGGSCVPVSGVLADHSTTTELAGDAAYRMSFVNRGFVVWRGLRGPGGMADPISALGATLVTGRDDLRTGSNVSLVVRLVNGTERTFPLNRGALLDNGSSHQFMPLFVEPSVFLSGDILSIGLRGDFGGGVGGDNWNVDRFAVDALGDPARTWVEGFVTAFDAMFRKDDKHFPGIALGTDLNGLQPQMPFALPNASTKEGTLAFMPEAFRIPRTDTTDGRTYSLERDGLAHIGLLPDFVNSMRSFPDTRTAVLLDSAEATINAWEKAEMRASLVTP